MEGCGFYLFDFKYLTKSFHNLAEEIAPLICVNDSRGQPNRQITFSARAQAIATESIFERDIASEYFVRQSCTVKIYRLPLSVMGKGPTISICILSKALRGVSVIFIGSFPFCRTSLTL